MITVILAEVIFNLFETKVDFLNSVSEVYIYKKNPYDKLGSLWFSLEKEDCNIWVKAEGDGVFKLFKIQKGIEINFEDPWEYAIDTSFWDSHSYYSFDTAVKRLLVQ